MDKKTSKKLEGVGRITLGGLSVAAGLATIVIGAPVSTLLTGSTASAAQTIRSCEKSINGGWENLKKGEALIRDLY